MVNRERAYYMLATFISGILFLYVSILVGKDFFRTIDFQMMQYLQTTIARIYDVPFSFFTLAGSTEVTLLVMALIFILVLLRVRHMFMGLSLYFSLFAIEIVGKLMIFHPNPPAIFNRYSLNIRLPSSFIVHTASSYPSGHMSRASFIAFILVFLIFKMKHHKYLKYMLCILIFIFILGMFISRIYLGEHWFSDVIGGLVLGSTVAGLAVCFW